MAIEVTPGLESGLKELDRNAFEILINLTDLRFNQVKDALGLPTPGKLGPQTLNSFIAFAKKNSFDLSDAGINTFKEKHGLGNSGALKGVIGRQTATEIVDTLFPHAIPDAPPTDRKINADGLALVKEFEGLAEKIPNKTGFVRAYLDSVKVPTIGYGHTEGVKLGQVISVAQAETFLKADLTEAEDGVERLVKRAINDNQFSALVSFAFNLGVGALAGSTLLKKVNAGDFAGAANEFPKWSNAGGKQLPGLLRRRNAERALFLS